MAYRNGQVDGCTDGPFWRLSWALGLDRPLYVDRGVDWVGRVLRERMLADLQARILREGERERARARDL